MYDHAPRTQLIKPTLPALPGVGYKPQHFTDLSAPQPDLGWLEIHAENYMGNGGRPLAQLRHLMDHYPISVHGVGLSIGGEKPLDREHLARLKYLCEWSQPASFSEHLAWSTHESGFLNDLLPLPYTEETLAVVVAHIDQVQHVLNRQMLLENPSTYLAFAHSEMDEITFLSEIARRTGCGLLLDVNNVYVACTNQALDSIEYINRFPLELVHEIHLGGHDEDVGDHGMPLLIDAHGSEVVSDVWNLYRHTIETGGMKATLIEWDNDVPDWPVLADELKRVSKIIAAATATQSPRAPLAQARTA